MVAAPKHPIFHYLSFIKFSHTVFALPFALIGFSLAIYVEQQAFSWLKLGLVVLCMIMARNSAMGFNRYLDRKIDAANPRTSQREVPAGKISPTAALAFTLINAALFCFTTYFINPLCLALAPVALFVILFYSYTKRITPLCHFVLGAGLGLAPIGAFLAVTGYFTVLPILLGVVVFLWVGGFDIIYAMQDINFDKSQKLKSIPTLLGLKKALQLSTAVHIAAIFILAIVGYILSLSFGTLPMILFWTGYAVFASFLVYQHTLVKPHDLSKVGLAFGTTNGIASIVFGSFTIISLILN